VGRPDSERFGAFEFREAIHEPGDKTLLGRRYPEAGREEGESALAALARHPATARHLAFKLARHFIADDPPPSLSDRLARTFLATDGDLAAVMPQLIDAREAWRAPLVKVKTPFDLVVSGLRATGVGGEPRSWLAWLTLLGQMPFSAPSPAGWPDVASAWLGPDALMRRIEWGMQVAAQ